MEPEQVSRKFPNLLRNMNRFLEFPNLLWNMNRFLELSNLLWNMTSSNTAEHKHLLDA